MERSVIHAEVGESRDAELDLSARSRKDVTNHAVLCVIRGNVRYLPNNGANQTAEGVSR